MPKERDESRKQSGNEFQAAGPATEKARRPNIERRVAVRTADGSRRTADAADEQCLREAMAKSGSKGQEGRQRKWGFWGGAASLLPPAGGLGERCKLPQAGSRAEPRPLQGFCAFYYYYYYYYYLLCP